MNARITIVLATALALAGIVLGCGDDDSSSSAAGGNGASAAQGDAGQPSSSGGDDSNGAMDKASFVEQANAACAKEASGIIEKANAYVERQGQGGQRVSPALLAQTIKAVVLPAFEAEIAAVRALNAPPGDEQRIEAMLDEQQAVIDELKKRKKIGAFVEVERAFVEAGKALRGYGLDECANG